MKTRLHQGRARGGGFALVELLVTIAILALLAALLLPGLARAKDEARKAQCLSNLRQLACVYHLYNEDNKNHLPTTAMLGYSSYRISHDPLSLCAYFQTYAATNNRVWLCPAGRPLLASNGVNYAWSRAQNVTSENGSGEAFGRMSDTWVMWDNFTMTLPSVFGVPENPGGGPSAVSPQLRYYPHSGGRKADYLYLDGHVATQ